MLVFNYAYQYKKCTKASSEYKNWNTGMISKKSVIRTLTNSSYAWNKSIAAIYLRKFAILLGNIMKTLIRLSNW